MRTRVVNPLKDNSTITVSWLKTQYCVYCAGCVHFPVVFVHVCTQCVTVDYAVFSPNNFPIRLHLLVVWELQVDGKSDFGSGQSRRIISNIESHFSTWRKKTGKH